MNTLISIIIPIYNVEDYLERCILSVLNQTYKKFEIILIDDCSTDRSGMIAKDYSLKYESCQYYKLDINSGQGVARNKGIEVSKGNWLFFVDSDDWIHEQTLELMLNSAQKYNSDIVMCGYFYAWDNKIKEIDSFESLSSNSSQNDKIALIPQASTTRRLYNKKFFESTNLLFPENLRRGEDIPLAIPILTYTDKVSIVNKPLYYYYQRVGSTSNSSVKIEDFNFYDDILHLVKEKSLTKFEKEVEFRMILEIVYGKTMLMIKSGKSNHEVREALSVFSKTYPEWRHNRYIDQCKRLKTYYIRAAAKEYFVLVRIFIFLYNLLKKF